MSETFSYGEGITGWAVEHREPCWRTRPISIPRVRFVPGNTGRARGSHRRSSDCARQPQGDAQHLPRRRGRRSSPTRSSSSRRASATPPRSRSTTPTSERARAPGLDRRTDRPLQPPNVPRPRSAGAHARVGGARHRRADHAGSRRLQEGQRRVRARCRRPAPAPGRGCAPRVRARERMSCAGWAARSSRSILPSGDLERLHALAERLGEKVGELDAGGVGRLTISTGIAVGPAHAANPRELVACAEAAMMTAKTRGKGSSSPSTRPPPSGRPEHACATTTFGRSRT